MPIEQADGGFLIRDAAINDIFQMLAKRAGQQYFHNGRLAGPEYNVSGHLNDGDPLQQMEELAFQFGLTMYRKGNTVYALSPDQLNQLPAEEWHYQLAYLRPTDMDQIKALVQPLLSPTGLVNYEPKTNTIVVIDSSQRVERVKGLLEKIDRAKGQIVIEVKILSVNSSAAQRVGVDWSGSLGEVGVPLEVAGSLNDLFGINSSVTSSGIGVSANQVLDFDETSSSSIVLSPMQVSGVLRALNEGGLVNQTSNPTLITEDNELATISLIDRVPIITQTVNQSNDSTNVTEEVRYQIDQKDPVGDPTTTREIGVTMSVTPTLLPDGTIRMRMRPRSAQIVATIEGQSGNLYPRVSEAMIETISRIPNGYSLIVGGFYGQVKNRNDNKVPLLGDIPLINFFFKSKEAEKETASLVFVVTPTSYNPVSAAENCATADRLRQRLSLEEGHDWIDDARPGPAHLPDLERGLQGLRPIQPQEQVSLEELQPTLDNCDDCSKSAKSTLSSVRRRR
jgi:type II secretory pathway component GspD/PulD (secretin)